MGSIGGMKLNHLNLRVKDSQACREFYEQYFGFRFVFEADGGQCLRNEDGFLLALIPVSSHQSLPAGFHIGFTLAVAEAEAVVAMHGQLGAARRVGPLEDGGAAEDYISFRCWDPDGTEIEVFWDGV